MRQESVRSAASGVFGSNRKLAHAVAMAVLTGLSSLAPAALTTLTWDNSGSTPAAPVDGAGSWNLSGTNWSNGSTDAAWVNTTPSTDGTSGTVAAFGSSATGGDISVDTAIVVAGIRVNKAGYTFSGSGSITGGGAGQVFNITSNADTTINTKLTGTNNFQIGGTGVTTLTNTGNDFTGLLLVNGGTLRVGSVAVNTSTPTVLGNGNTSQVRISGGGTFIYTGATGSNSHGLKMYGAATIDIEAGTVGTPTVFSTNYTTGNQTTSDTLTLTGSQYGSGVMNTAVTNSTATTPGVVSILKTGANTWTFNGANTYTGSTTVTGGTLAAKSTMATSQINLNGGSFDVSSQANFTLSGKLLGAGTFKGATTLTTLNGGVQVGQTDATSGTASTLSITGSAQLGTGTTSLDLFTAATLGSADKFVASANLGYGGTLAVSNQTGTSLANGMSWDLFDGTRIGTTTFSAMNLPALDAGLSWDLNYTTGVLSVVPEPTSLAMIALIPALCMRRRRPM